MINDKHDFSILNKNKYQCTNYIQKIEQLLNQVKEQNLLLKIENRIDKRMFTKKEFSYQMATISQPFKQISSNATHLTHEFFLLARDQKFQEAYVLGIKILKDNPNNTAVANFCDFIKNNSKGIAQILEEQEYTDGSDQEDDQDQEEDEEDQDEEEEEQKQKQNQPSFRSASNSVSSKVFSVSQKSQTKKVLPLPSKQVNNKQVNKEKVYKWDHNCKNPNCPNKNKPHRH